ncbi:MAG: DUF4062 domain-containing protein [Polyangiaceae bacterium]
MEDSAISVYLSSTLADLNQHRRAVSTALSRYCVVNDSYVADSRSTIASCLSDVRKAKVYIGIFAFRYGFIPTDPIENPGHLSITELEYQAARDANIPCLIFLLDPSHPWPTNQADSPRDRVDELRKGLGEAQRVALFKGEDELVLKVSNAVRDHIDRARREGARTSAPSMDPEARSTHPRQLSNASLLLYVEGTDDAAARLLSGTLKGNHTLRPFGFSPEDPPTLAAVDIAFSTCRSASLLVSRASLARLAPITPTIDAWFKLFQHQTGPCMLLTDRLPASDLPQQWQVQPICDLSDWLARGTPTITEPLTTFLSDMKRIHVDFDRQGLIGLPYSVLAMTREEAERLEQRVHAGLDAAGPTSTYLAALRTWFIGKGINWTARYGTERAEFRPFDTRTAIAVLRDIVRDINDQDVVPPRDRENLRGNLIRLRLYPFDPSVVQDGEAKRLFGQVKRRGCLIIADDLSLCEPSLRGAARRFFDERSVSVVALTARDPMLVPLEKAVEDVMDVGDLLNRFRDRLDLRCELAVVSLAGLRRWFRFSVPETLGTNELESADPDRRAQFRRETFG